METTQNESLLAGKDIFLGNSVEHWKSYFLNFEKIEVLTEYTSSYHHFRRCMVSIMRGQNNLPKEKIQGAVSVHCVLTALRLKTLLYFLYQKLYTHLNEGGEPELKSILWEISKLILGKKKAESSIEMWVLEIDICKNFKSIVLSTDVEKKVDIAFFAYIKTLQQQIAIPKIEMTSKSFHILTEMIHGCLEEAQVSVSKNRYIDILETLITGIIEAARALKISLIGFKRASTTEIRSDLGKVLAGYATAYLTSTPKLSSVEFSLMFQPFLNQKSISDNTITYNRIVTVLVYCSKNRMTREETLNVVRNIPTAGDYLGKILDQSTPKILHVIDTILKLEISGRTGVRTTLEENGIHFPVS